MEKPQRGFSLNVWLRLAKPGADVSQSPEKLQQTYAPSSGSTHLHIWGPLVLYLLYFFCWPTFPGAFPFASIPCHGGYCPLPASSPAPISSSKEPPPPVPHLLKPGHPPQIQFSQSPCFKSFTAIYSLGDYTRASSCSQQLHS